MHATRVIQRLIVASAMGFMLAAVAATPALAALPSPTLAAVPRSSLPAVPPMTYTMNLYDAGGVRYQDPDYTSCVATSGQMMLNEIAAAGTGGSSFVWKASTSYATQEKLLTYMRAHMSQVGYHPGTDAHGWKNGLNYFGWGSITAGVYVDASYSSYTAAAKAAVVAMAEYHKPIGIMAWAGGHGQLMNGYKVYGDDPATGSTNFTIQGVYITDPLHSDGYRNHYTTNAQWSSGPSNIRFAPYIYEDDPGRDAVDHGIGNSQWFHRWVMVVPVK